MNLFRNKKIKTMFEQEAGSALVEFSFILPVLLFILTSIHQVGDILTEKAFLSETLRTSARFSSTLVEDCGQTSNDEFRKEYAKAGNVSRIKLFKASYHEFLYTDSTTSSSPVAAIELKAQVGVPCYLCKMIFNIDSSIIDLSSTVRVPLEEGLSCPLMKIIPFVKAEI